MNGNTKDVLVDHVVAISEALAGDEYTYNGNDLLRFHLGRIADYFGENKPAGAGSVANQAASTAADVSGLKDDFNALLLKLKNAGVMVGEQFTLQFATVTDSVTGRADRQYNTDKISSVTESEGVITITLASGTKVADLRDFEAGNGWGTHKWLGIGISAGISPITGLSYNGTALTADDVSEATEQCGLSAGYFVRWVAADLVLAGNNTQKSKGYFTLNADGYWETKYTLKIVEG